MALLQSSLPCPGHQRLLGTRIHHATTAVTLRQSNHLRVGDQPVTGKQHSSNSSAVDGVSMIVDSIQHRLGQDCTCDFFRKNEAEGHWHHQFACSHCAKSSLAMPCQRTRSTKTTINQTTCVVSKLHCKKVCNCSFAALARCDTSRNRRSGAGTLKKTSDMQISVFRHSSQVVQVKDKDNLQMQHFLVVCHQSNIHRNIKSNSTHRQGRMAEPSSITMGNTGEPIHKKKQAGNFTKPSKIKQSIGSSSALTS